MPNTKDYDFPLLKSDVTLLVQEAVLSALEGNVYDHKKVRSPQRSSTKIPDLTMNHCFCLLGEDVVKVNDWVTSVTTSCIDDLRRLSPNFKYIVTCFVRQRKGAGLEFHSEAVWDEKADGACIVSWENPSMSVVVAVYGIAITSS